MNSIWGAVHDWLFEASALDWSLRLVWAAAVPQTLFVLIYVWTPWKRSWVGRAVFTKATALFLLLDLSLFNYVYGKPYPHMEEIGNTVLALVAAGASLQLFALIHEMWRPTRRDGFVARRTETAAERSENP